MKTNTVLFWILTVFFAVMAVVYTIWSIIDFGQPEWAGSVALSLSAILAAFLAFYIGRTNSGLGGQLPEDRLDANIDDGDPELGHFSPWSWWPVVMAAAAAVIFMGLGIGFWIAFIGVPVLLIAVVGWTYEYYRGYFAR